MKVECAWCKQGMGEKEPLKDSAVTHSICGECAKGLKAEIQKMPKAKKNPEREVQVGFADWPRLVEYFGNEGWKPLGTGVRFSRTVLRKNLQGSLFQIIQKEARGWRLLHRNFLTPQAGEPESLGLFRSFDEALIAANRDASDWLGNYQVSKNPGAEWHGMKELEADQMDRHAKKKSQKDFFHGKSVAHLESGLAARAMGDNPLAVFGFANPNRRRRPSPVRKYRGVKNNSLKQFTAGIAGVVYSRCWEVRAEKTSLSAERAGFKRGLYKHPFKRSSKVEVLALDNGDLLLHSTVGVKLW